MVAELTPATTLFEKFSSRCIVDGEHERSLVPSEPWVITLADGWVLTAAGSVLISKATANATTWSAA